jgi:hypothetical protein
MITAVSNWSPQDIADGVIRVGWKLGIMVGVVVISWKLLDALKAKWSK